MCTPKIISCEKDYATTFDKDTLKSALTGLASPEQTWSPLRNMLKSWIIDKHGKPITRFQGFDLYKMIARRMTCTAPLYQLRQPHFQSFVVSKKKCCSFAQSDGCVIFNLTSGGKANSQGKASAGRQTVHHRCQKWTFSNCSSESSINTTSSSNNSIDSLAEVLRMQSSHRPLASRKQKMSFRLRFLK